MVNRVDARGDLQQFQPEVPSYSKSKLVVGVVALVTIAAVGCLIAHFTGAHVPKWMQSHKFQLATEIGSPLGAVLSIFTSVLLTQVNKRNIEEQTNNYLQEQQRLEEQQCLDHTRRVADCHPKPTKFSSQLIQEEGDVILNVPDTKADWLSKETSIDLHDTSLAEYGNDTALIKCQHYCSSNLFRSFSKTENSPAYFNACSIKGTVVHVYGPSGESESASLITRTIYQQYKQRLADLTHKKTKRWSPTSMYKWVLCQAGQDITTLQEKEQVMADAIHAVTANLTASYVVFVRFGDTLFVKKPANVRINLISKSLRNFELEQAGLYRFEVKNLSGQATFVTGDSEFTKTVSKEEVAGLPSINNFSLNSGGVLNAALLKRNPESREMEFAEAVNPMSCMVYRV